MPGTCSHLCDTTGPNEFHIGRRGLVWLAMMVNGHTHLTSCIHKGTCLKQGCGLPLRLLRAAADEQLRVQALNMEV